MLIANSKFLGMGSKFLPDDFHSDFFKNEFQVNFPGGLFAYTNIT